VARKLGARITQHNKLFLNTARIKKIRRKKLCETKTVTTCSIFHFCGYQKKLRNKFTTLKPENAPATRSTEDITFTCQKEPRPVMLSEDLPINSTGEAKKKAETRPYTLQGMITSKTLVD